MTHDTAPTTTDSLFLRSNWNLLLFSVLVPTTTIIIQRWSLVLDDQNFTIYYLKELEVFLAVPFRDRVRVRLDMLPDAVMQDTQFPFLEITCEEFSSQNAAFEEDLSQLLDQTSKGDFSAILSHRKARLLLGHEDNSSTESIRLGNYGGDYSEYIRRRLSALAGPSPQGDASDPSRIEFLFIGVVALHAFLQSNVTGPPLSLQVTELIFPDFLLETPSKVEKVQQQMLQDLSVDGEAMYALTPHVELFWLAKTILCEPSVVGNKDGARWARMRVNFWHQKMLGENATSLQEEIFRDADFLAESVLKDDRTYGREARVQFVLERAAILTHHGFDVKAREDLQKAAKETGFEFAITGRLGKRTKFQEKEISQLVVLAKSAEEDKNDLSHSTSDGVKGALNGEGRTGNGTNDSGTRPQNLNLNDDTLLDSISFSKITSSAATTVQNEESLPSRLASLDPSNQPILKPQDSIILLSIASSITNTSPQHGLTREGTLPYATRVLEGGSTNWQIYTQALLVRSRIECYKSRTVERGVLQLQALVDQVIAETTSTISLTGNGTSSRHEATSAATTFLPRPELSESAPVSERLQYIHQLSSPTRWELEAELAVRWVSLGGLRTALEIYERLQMWAEAALCWAATDREDKARRIVRRQLYQPSKGPETGVRADKIQDGEKEEEEWQGPERNPLPADAPRLYCILGDIDKDPNMYERAWEVSKHRYARAQRSLGRYHYAAKNFNGAEEAYAKSLTVSRLDHPTWFALGCVRLELENWQGAVDAFSRTVQLDDRDAEAWSNLAAALLRLSPSTSTTTPSTTKANDNDDDNDDDNNDQPSSTLINPSPQRPLHDALAALKRASTLSHTSYRIWSNLLTVASRLRPPPYTDILIAQKRLIELGGPIEGESCIDAPILDRLVRHVIALDGADSNSDTATTPNSNANANLDIDIITNPTTKSPQKPRPHPRGISKMLADLLEHDVLPLITSSRALYRILARWHLYRNRPARALDATERAWRAVLARLGWDVGMDDGGKGWEEVVDATVELVDAYESLGPRERTEGLAGGGEGEWEGDGEEGEQGKGKGAGVLVCKEWRFKARSAVRGVLGRAKGAWEGSEGWARLKARGEGLRGV